LKRLLFLSLCLVLVSSCCLRTDSAGVTTKSFRNCAIAAQEMVCNPPDNVKAVVQIAAHIVAGIVNIAIPGSVEYFNAQTALNVINSIQQIGCTSLTALNQLIAFMQSPTFQMAAKSGKYAAGPVSVNVQPLVDWSHTAK
jgi:hypothetical protein